MAGADVAHGPEETEPLLGTLLRKPYQVLVAEGIEPALAAAGFDDVRVAHLPVVQALTQWSEGLRATELAAHARITKQSMGYLVAHLEARGYVERVPDPADGRAQIVRLTPRGWEMGHAIRDGVRRVETDWARRIGAGRVEELRDLLHDLVGALED